jgi:hypothetical protein
MNQFQYRIFDASHNLGSNPRQQIVPETDDIGYRLNRFSDVLPHYLSESEILISQRTDHLNPFSIIVTLSTTLSKTLLEVALRNYLHDHQQYGKSLQT